MDVLVVSSFLAGAAPITSKDFAVHPVKCVDDHAYWRGLTDVWDSDAVLVVVEHDMQCSDALIRELATCKHRLCTWAYKLYWPSTHRPIPEVAQRHNPPVGCEPDRKYLGSPIPDGHEWADFTGLGFCKIAREVRLGVPDEQHWATLDTKVNAAVVGRWHVHWPAVEHYHQ